MDTSARHEPLELYKTSPSNEVLATTTFSHSDAASNLRRARSEAQGVVYNAGQFILLSCQKGSRWIIIERWDLSCLVHVDYALKRLPDFYACAVALSFQLKADEMVSPCGVLWDRPIYVNRPLIDPRACVSTLYILL